MITYENKIEKIRNDSNSCNKSCNNSKQWVHIMGNKIIYFLAIALRVILYCYGIWQDTNFEVKFTDVDYYVYSDAAKYILNGESPYSRYTYRYTPLLAYLMLPNFWIHYSFGKLAFSVIDFYTSIIIIKILQIKYPQCKNYVFYTTLWIINPFVIVISLRGNADCIPSLLVMLTLFFIYKKKIIFAAFFYGLSVSFKIYPIIYALPVMLYLNPNYLKKERIRDLILGKGQRTFVLKNGIRNILLLPFRFLLEAFKLNWDQLYFFLISFATFVILNIVFYIKYGYQFLFEAYLYHLVRTDHRHNFSIFFYMMYLSTGKKSIIISLITFFPQMLLVILLGAKYARRNMELALFLQTVVFIAMNKVCTSQYFVWWMPFLPLVLHSITLNKSNLWIIMRVIVFFILTKAHWLLWAYYLEFKGYNTFLLLMFASILFVLSQMSICWSFMHMEYKERKLLK